MPRGCSNPGIHLHGVAGVREGLHLIAELCDTYWDGLHPDLQDGDLDYRLAPLIWIDEKLSIAVKLIPVTCPQSEDLPRYTIADWELACRTPGRKTGDRREEATLERIQQSAALTPASWLSQVARDARGALAALQELHDVLEGRCGRQAPALSKLRDTLESIRGLLSTALQGRMPAPAPEMPAASEAPGGEVDEVSYTGEPGRFPVRSRAEAYQLLAQAADDLARTEPHSPVPHLVRRAITGGIGARGSVARAGAGRRPGIADLSTAAARREAAAALNCRSRSGSDRQHRRGVNHG